MWVLRGAILLGLVGSAAADPVDLIATVTTKQPRAQLSEALVAGAKQAVKAKAYSRAIPLYQALVVARGPGSAEAKELATLWTAAKQTEQAASAWRAYATATNDAAALAESQRLAAIADPLADKLVLAALVAEAKRTFVQARKALAAKQYGDALVLFHMGNALAPELPGYLRELGTVYDKLHADEPKRRFYFDALQARPLGPNADAIRKLLGNDPQLATLVVSASLPCTEIWINRQRITKIPATGIVVAPGSYKGLCFNPKYEMALFEYATAAPGKPAAMTFSWAIIENRLEQPFGRIALENFKSPGMMIDLGITTREIGVAAPTDGRKLKLIVKDDTGTRSETRSVAITPGQRLVIRW